MYEIRSFQDVRRRWKTLLFFGGTIWPLYTTVIDRSVNFEPSVDYSPFMFSTL